jgi:hypothetical protein
VLQKLEKLVVVGYQLAGKQRTMMTKLEEADLFVKEVFG